MSPEYKQRMGSILYKYRKGITAKSPVFDEMEALIESAIQEARREAGKTYANGHVVGELKTIRDLQERLRGDEELRTLAGLMEVLRTWESDKQQELKKIQLESIS